MVNWDACRRGCETCRFNVNIGIMTIMQQQEKDWDAYLRQLLSPFHSHFKNSSSLLAFWWKSTTIARRLKRKIVPAVAEQPYFSIFMRRAGCATDIQSEFCTSSGGRVPDAEDEDEECADKESSLTSRLEVVELQYFSVGGDISMKWYVSSSSLWNAS